MDKQQAPAGLPDVKVTSSSLADPLVGGENNRLTSTSLINKNPATSQEIGLAAILGVSSGYATKKVAKGSAFLVGLVFIGLQALAHTKVINVNWAMIEKHLISRVDQDGDAKLTTRDMQLAVGRFIHLLSSDLPSSASFAAAFVLGFRYG